MATVTESRLFGAVERRLFRATAVVAAVIAFTILIASMIWALGLVLSYFYNLIMPLCVAGILALILYPVVDYIEQRGSISRLAATSIIVLSFVAIIVGAIVMLVPLMARQIEQFSDFGPDLIAGWQSSLESRLPGIIGMLKDSAQDGEIKKLMPAMDDTGRTVRSYVGLLVGLSFVPLMLFFALLSGGRLRAQTRGALTIFSAQAQKKIMYFVDVFLTQVTGFFQGQLVIGVIMGVMFAIGFTSIGLTGGIFIGLALGLLNIVPFLGTLIGLLIVLPLGYFQPSGGFQLMGLALLVFTIVQLVESWLLTPRIMANRSGLHPALVVISVFFWGIALGGITGMILAVPLTAFLVAVWSQAKQSLANSLRSDEEASRIETTAEAGTDESQAIKAPFNHPATGESEDRQAPPAKR